MDHTPQSNEPEHKDKERSSTAPQSARASDSEGAAGQPALGNQTDMGDQTATNVAGDQPAKTPPDRKERRDEAAAYSNSPSDKTNRSQYGSKAGRMDSGGIASTGRDENAARPKRSGVVSRSR